MSECTNISRCEQCKYLCFRSLSIILSVLRKGEWWNSLQSHAGSGWLKLKCEKCRKKWKLQLVVVYSVYSICCMHLDIFIGCWLLCRKKHALCSSAELHWLRSSVSSSWRWVTAVPLGRGADNSVLCSYWEKQLVFGGVGLSRCHRILHGLLWPWSVNGPTCSCAFQWHPPCFERSAQRIW